MAKSKDSSSVSISGPADTSGLRRSSRETSSKKQTTTLSNIQTSEQIDNQTAPTPSPIKKTPEKSDNQMSPSPLRRSDRTNKHSLPTSSESNKLVEVPINRRQEPAGGKKRKSFTAREYKALFKPQRIRDDDKDQEGSSNRDVARLDSNKNGCTLGDERPSGTPESRLKNMDDQGTPDLDQTRINHGLESQQELDSCDKELCGTSTSKAIQSDTSKFVEFWVPVQISNVQLEQYCSALLSNAMALRSCKKSDNMGATNNILNSNRKCCNHPYTVDPELQSKITKDRELTMILDIGIKASGKLQFLDIILSEIKKRQLRVVILFQPTGVYRKGLASIVDIFDDFVLQRFGLESYARVNGVGMVPSKKQEAIDSFNNEMTRFIFLLEHRACLPNIKLSSVDMIIIFDSDLNPSNDLRALQKISIGSKSEQIMIFRLYSSTTLEENILKLAEHNVAIEGKLQRSTCDALLMWGAEDLFKKLSEFHSASNASVSSEESWLKDVVEEFLYLVANKCKGKDAVKSVITRIESFGSYGKKNSLLLNETQTKLLPDGEQPRIFWRKLLEGWCPQWQFVSVSTPRQRKRPLFFGDSVNETNVADADVARKRGRKSAATSKAAVEGETGGINEGGCANDEAQSSSGDQYWCPVVRDETSVSDLLKPTVYELCKILKFPEDVKIIMERFLEFVLENYHVSKEHTRALQAFMISLCWIASSLSNYEIDHKESFALAKRHLSFICLEEEANSAYLKLELAKETFIRHTELTEPKTSNTNPQGVKPDNVESQREEVVDGKIEKEIEQFNREWDDKREQLEDDYKLDKALIRTLHTNPSVRSEKLKALEKAFANNLKEHERNREIHFNDLKAKMLAAEGQVAANHKADDVNVTIPNQNIISVEIPNGGSDKGNAISCDGGNDIESTGSHMSIYEERMAEVAVSSVPVGETPAQQHGGTDADVAVTSVQVEEISAQQLDGTDADVAVASVLIDKIPAQKHDGVVDNVAVLSVPVEEISAQQHDGVEDVAGADVATSSVPIEENPAQQHDVAAFEEISTQQHDVAGADATVSSVPVEKIPAEPHDDNDDVAGPSDTVELEVAEDVINRNETGPSDTPLQVKPNEMEMEMDMEISADDLNNEDLEDGEIGPETSSHAVEDQNESCGPSSSNSPSAPASQDKSPSPHPIASPPSDHSTPAGNSNNENAVEEQVNPTSPAEVVIDIPQPIDSEQVAQTNPEDPSVEPYDDPVISDNESDIPSVSDLLHETTCGEEQAIESAENHANTSDHNTTPQSEQSLEERQLHVPLLNSPQNTNTSVPRVTPEFPNQNALCHNLNLADPLQTELERLVLVKDHAFRTLEDTKQKLKADCEKEIAEAIAQITLKYDAKCQEEEAAFDSKKKEIDKNLENVRMNKILADAFRSKCKDVTPGSQQGSPGGLMQQRFSMRRPPGVASSSSPAQPSGSHRTTQPPLQIVHQSAALFSHSPTPPGVNSTPHFAYSLTRPRPGVNSTTPSPVVNSTPPTRPPSPVVNSTPPTTPSPVVNSTTPTRPPSPVVNSTPPTRPPPVVNSTTPIRPPPVVNPATPIRPPPGFPTITPTSTPNGPPGISELTMSAANLRVNSETRGYIRPLVTAEIRAPAPHMRPSVSTEIRAPAPHLRPSVSSELRAPAPHLRPFRPPPSYQRVPLTSPTSSQPLQVLSPISTASPPPLQPPIPPEASYVPPPPPPPPPLQRISSIPTSQTVDSANVFMDVATHRLRHNMPPLYDSMELTEFMREGGAPSSSGHDLVCLSDDD